MNKKERSHDFRPDSADNDEVEILEVVGVEEDAPAPSSSADEDLDDSDAIVLTLDGDDEELEFEDESSPRTADPQVDSSLSESDAEERARAESELAARLRADYDNLRKRVARERDEFELRANSQLIEGLLPILDNFDRALSVDLRSDNDGAFRAGMVMIYNQLGEALKKEGLRKIDSSVGRTFDPNLHDAVATDGNAPEAPNTIIEELQRGYLFQDRVLRPAMVKVSTNNRERPAGDPADEDR